MRRAAIFGESARSDRRFEPADALLLAAVAALLYFGIRVGLGSPATVAGPQISLAPAALPWYATLSLGRMTAAYLLSLAFSLVYGYVAARSRTARGVLLPILDVLQSVPILSFLPVVLLGLSAVLHEDVAVELAAIVLIFTSQAWNLTFSFYQSMSTLPMELREAAAVYRFRAGQRLRWLELPFAVQGLVWNSMMSWSGGWFFLMAAEIFHAGARDFRLPGLGSYLQAAASEGDLGAVARGLAALVVVIVLLDQLLWRPVIVWADRFRLETVEGEEAPKSWFLDLLARSRLLRALRRAARAGFARWADGRPQRAPARIDPPEPAPDEGGRAWAPRLIFAALAVLAGWGAVHAYGLLATLPARTWLEVGAGLGATFLRVLVALVVSLAWTIPLGVAIGTNRRFASLAQPVVQILSAIPATALFPVVLLLLLPLPAGAHLAAVALMLMGSQWYLLFNVIAGASAIPQDLRQTTDLLRLSRGQRWRTLLLPALFPYLVTGALTASGGAWNASIVAEYVDFGGRTREVTGLGALIARATALDQGALLLAATLVMVLVVVLVNRLFWRRLYRLAEERYRLE